MMELALLQSLTCHRFGLVEKLKKKLQLSKYSTVFMFNTSSCGNSLTFPL